MLLTKSCCMRHLRSEETTSRIGPFWSQHTAETQVNPFLCLFFAGRESDLGTCSLMVPHGNPIMETSPPEIARGCRKGLWSPPLALEAGVTHDSRTQWCFWKSLYRIVKLRNNSSTTDHFLSVCGMMNKYHHFVSQSAFFWGEILWHFAQPGFSWSKEIFLRWHHVTWPDPTFDTESSRFPTVL